MSPIPVREKDAKEKPATKPNSVDTAVAETAEASGASVEKIREILFGSQIKNYEARFARLEEALARETSEIKDTMRRRLDSLEAFFKSETESLAARLKSERRARGDPQPHFERVEDLGSAAVQEDSRSRQPHGPGSQRESSGADGRIAQAARRNSPAQRVSQLAARDSRARTASRQDRSLCTGRLVCRARGASEGRKRRGQGTAQVGAECRCMRRLWAPRRRT